MQEQQIGGKKKFKKFFYHKIFLLLIIKMIIYSSYNVYVKISMTEIFDLLEKSAAYLKGHFILSSGLHSDTYIQCANIFKHHDIVAELCGDLAQKIKEKIDFDIIVSPAMGGVIPGYEIGRRLNKPAIFCERRDGQFSFTRFTQPNNEDLLKGKKILVIEDVITTGKSSLETVDAIENEGGTVVAEACMFFRPNISSKTKIIKKMEELERGKMVDKDPFGDLHKFLSEHEKDSAIFKLLDKLDKKIISRFNLWDIKSYHESELPDHLQNVPAIKLGSRKVTKV